MPRLFRVHVDPSAPRIAATAPARYGPDFLIFDGRAKDLGHHVELELTLESSSDGPRQYYGFVPGVLALPNAAWEDSDDVYYPLVFNNEINFATAGGKRLTLTNPRNVVGPDPAGVVPCRLDRVPSPLFRIGGRDPFELYCAAERTGMVAASDEFKHAYDEFGFRGLIFEEVWGGEIVKRDG